jgi:hypothetical protein
MLSVSSAIGIRKRASLRMDLSPDAPPVIVRRRQAIRPRAFRLCKCPKEVVFSAILMPRHPGN